MNRIEDEDDDENDAAAALTLPSTGGEGEASASSLSSSRHSELRFCLRRRLRCFLRVAAGAALKSGDAFVDGGIKTLLTYLTGESNFLKNFAQGRIGMGNFEGNASLPQFRI